MSTAVCVEGIDALHLVRIIAGALDCDPSPSDFVTAVKYIIGIDNQRRLAAAASDEGCLCNCWLRTLMQAR